MNIRLSIGFIKNRRMILFNKQSKVKIDKICYNFFNMKNDFCIANEIRKKR